jgi:hypothetical protein
MPISINTANTEMIHTSSLIAISIQISKQHYKIQQSLINHGGHVPDTPQL